VSEHWDRPYRAERSLHWRKIKNPAPPAMKAPLNDRQKEIFEFYGYKFWG
jgi:hypothetical protein